MDEAKRKEIEGRIADCKLRIAGEQAKVVKYEAQLAAGKVGHTKPRAKTGQKQSKAIPKTTETPPTEKKKEGFWDVVLS